ncbi:hypothetical protein HSBAA_58070 [Vreelandella sulfidaeris]|uniref:Uncharacterized protein n=1 Tax=Vreelandella sulfidaeris TaxID=115553 RepID=A0A455UIK7_9GAMM|nr:hypothetical protein HSBAA_58070 [Halomonas sulfidaeris]
MRISGMPILPIAAQVAGEEPDSAAKIEQAPILETAKPPGSLPIHKSSERYRSRPVGDEATAAPIKINIGIATKPNSAMRSKKVSPK